MSEQPSPKAHGNLNAEQTTSHGNDVTFDGIVPTGRKSTAMGPYKLLKLVGEGGMGEVWLAEQERPVRRRVALKLVKTGMNSREVVGRFETERQALALMDHPAIAKVFDAGSTLDGSPYFAMEYVPGLPITTYCDEHNLTMRGRLELFILVCQAVQHAHQKAILHRDLKPSNILVTEIDDKPWPKVIDFGVAKAIAQRLTAETMFTQVGALIGTPEYMSPEQADSAGLDIDTRTDVYSLGVILYELMVGAVPLDLRSTRGLTFQELLRRLREEDAVRPSTRARTLATVHTIAGKRRTDSATLIRQLRGDLDCIAMKALEKDRSRRYSSAADLAADIERYLNDQPVTATAPSAVYRLKKFERRHRSAVVAGVILLVGLILFAITMSIQTIRLARERDRANQEAETAQQVAGFLTGLFEKANPYQAHGKQLTAQDLLDQGAQQIGSELKNQPKVQAELMQAMGQSYLALGLKSKAMPLVEKAWKTREKLLGPDDPKTLSSMQDVFFTKFRRIPPPDAEKLARDLAERARRKFGAGSVDAAHYTVPLIWGLDVSSKFGEEAKLAHQTLATYNAHGRHNTHDAAWVELMESRALGEDNKSSQAVPLAQDAWQTLRRTSGVESHDALLAQAELAQTLVLANQIASDQIRGMELFRQTIQTFARIAGPAHNDTVNLQFDMATTCERVGRFADAEAPLAAALKAVAGDHTKEAIVLANIAALNLKRGRPAAAVRTLKQAMDMGYESPAEIAADPDWATLRSEPGFQALVADPGPNTNSTPRK